MGRATSLSLGMTNKPHPLLLPPLLLLPLLLLLLCSPLAVSGRSQLAKDQATFQKTGDRSDYSNEEYEEVGNRQLAMEEMEQNYDDKLQSKYSLSTHKRQMRQVGEKDYAEESSGDTEPILVEDPQGWGLAHVLGIASLVCLVIYIIGITYKLIKMHLGTYVREDPVFLKYK